MKIVKGTKTGKSAFASAKSIFQLIRPSKSAKSGVYGGYKGEKNITFIGEGFAAIDMNYSQDGIAIIAGHNQNVRVENITLQDDEPLDGLSIHRTIWHIKLFISQVRNRLF
ncbi:hypothetical protein [Fictibacillus terranigra]|uniref:Pectate lyase n=1 Tax=Fictibacillus terranigra TaxID=3058424 RepID=A0ABT8E2U2_9BACL|nr:hypothetical protein [Fictibacillus sp. CENA-BCM004]MDN4072206.1 hypothetical protein [Fictibacillus sp. CENA-BCM004]